MGLYATPFGSQVCERWFLLSSGFKPGARKITNPDIYAPRAFGLFWYPS